MFTPDITVVGGGLAGSEAAWQIAESGLLVELVEMRPLMTTGAHATSYLAELVCSNSLGSNQPDRAGGLLQEELSILKSMVLACALETTVPAGGALAVDREAFAHLITMKIEAHPNIRVIRKECTSIPGGPAVIATGPLTSRAMSAEIAAFTGQEQLFFYDAIAPIVSFDSINFDIAFRGSRFDWHEHNLHDRAGDYINCPFNPTEYENFVDALSTAERIPLKEFELELVSGVQAGKRHYFEGCLPVEVLAQRDKDALAYGPMRPVGLIDPRTAKRPYAVVQLRQDNLAGSLYNMVGFQTNLTMPEQRRVFHLIPGLEQATFERYGQMHRNTFIFSPGLLHSTLQSRNRENLFFAGQITGVEGYAGNIATGLLAGLNSSRWFKGQELLTMPHSTMLGALCRYITQASAKDFQPMKANFGILPPLESNNRKIGRRQKGLLYHDRAISSLHQFMSTNR